MPALQRLHNGKVTIPPITRQAWERDRKRTPSLTALESSAGCIVPTAKDSGTAFSRHAVGETRVALLSCAVKDKPAQMEPVAERRPQAADLGTTFVKRERQKQQPAFSEADVFKRPLASPAYHEKAGGKEEV